MNGWRRSRPESRCVLEIERPLFIIAAPRSGSSMLFEALARSDELWTLGGEAHAEFESVPHWRPANRGYESNRLTEEDCHPSDRVKLLSAFAPRLRNCASAPWLLLPPEKQRIPVRLLEKTPKNSLRIPLLRALFPDARFVFLWREPRSSVTSMMEAWLSGRFVTYGDLPGWDGLPWSLLLPPGWRELSGASLANIASHQWRVANTVALDDLHALPNDAWCIVEYGELVAEPDRELERLCDIADVPSGPVLESISGGSLPPSRHTITSPDPEKWVTLRHTIDAVLPEVRTTWELLRSSRDG